MSFHMNNKIQGCFEIMRFNFVLDKDLTPKLKDISCNLDQEVSVKREFFRDWPVTITNKFSKVQSISSSYFLNAKRSNTKNASTS